MLTTVSTNTRSPAPKRPKYRPPEESESGIVSAKELGFGASFLLKVPQLYAAGDLSLLSVPMVAIVGSRKSSPEAQKRTAKLVRGLVEAGVGVMSGLAEGIDEAAHRTAIAVGGKTIAVIGTPLDKVYPAKHSELQKRIYEEHLLLSPFELGSRVFPSNFPLRNTVMANLSRATVIIEASDTSGTLHQAAECARAGRPLFIARSVYSTPGVTWPARFKDAIPLETVSQILDLLL